MRAENLFCKGAPRYFSHISRSYNLNCSNPKRTTRVVTAAITAETLMLQPEQGLHARVVTAAIIAETLMLQRSLNSHELIIGCMKDYTVQCTLT